MSAISLLSKALFVGVFAASGTYVHFRGRVRLRLLRQLFDHSTVMAPYNSLMYLFSAVPTRPFVEVSRFPELAPLREHWETIRDEALRLFDEGYIKAAAKHHDIGFSTFFKTGWKRFYLKWYDDFLPSATALCPKTAELVAGIPTVHAAMFALLPPGARLGAHRDPYAGSLRYHLGLRTPNSERCRIIVDGEPYHWHDGEDVVFDETYIHSAENATDETRLILFCDVERPLRTPVVRALNRWFGNTLVRAGATSNLEGEKVGFLNKLFGGFFEVRQAGMRLKQRNKPAYTAVKWAANLTLVGLLVLLLVAL